LQFAPQNFADRRLRQLDSGGAMMRATMSATPPGGKPAMKRSGLFG
jgi:hypothetical protein